MRSLLQLSSGEFSLLFVHLINSYFLSACLFLSGLDLHLEDSILDMKGGFVRGGEDAQCIFSKG